MSVFPLFPELLPQHSYTDPAKDWCSSVCRSTPRALNNGGLRHADGSRRWVQTITLSPGMGSGSRSLLAPHSLPDPRLMYRNACSTCQCSRGIFLTFNRCTFQFQFIRSFPHSHLMPVFMWRQWNWLWCFFPSEKIPEFLTVKSQLHSVTVHYSYLFFIFQWKCFQAWAFSSRNVWEKLYSYFLRDSVDPGHVLELEDKTQFYRCRLLGFMPVWTTRVVHNSDSHCVDLQ